MSVLNKMLRDLDQRSALGDRLDGIPGRSGLGQRVRDGGARWKIVNAFAVPTAVAAAWIEFGPSVMQWWHGGAVRPPQQASAVAPPAPGESRSGVNAARNAPAPALAAKPDAPVVALQTPSAAPLAAPAVESSAVPVLAPGTRVVEIPEKKAAPVKPPAKAEETRKAPVIAAQAGDSLLISEVAAPAPTPKRDPVQTEVAAEKPAAKTAASRPEVKPAAVAVRETRERAPAAETAALAAKGRISIERADREPTRTERAAVEYRNAAELLNQGQMDLAIETYANALRLDPGHTPARQALTTLLLRRGRMAEAQSLLRDGLRVAPANSSWAMLLARLQVESGDRAGATETLDAVLPYAKDRPDYHAFAGTVLQLQGRHKEAIAHYEISVRLAPESGPWLTGLAVSLEEEKRVAEAREAYQRALTTSSLAAEQRTFVERKLGQMK